MYIFNTYALQSTKLHTIYLQMFFQKLLKSAMHYGYTPLIPELGRQRQADLKHFFFLRNKQTQKVLLKSSFKKYIGQFG